MATPARPFPELSQDEWKIIIELLERERTELPVEIRHTFRHAFRNQLEQRLSAIESLLDRVTRLVGRVP